MDMYKRKRTLIILGVTAMVLTVFIVMPVAAVSCESPLIEITGDCKNSFGHSVAKCTLKGWFEYDPDKDEYPIGHVVVCDTTDDSGMHECLAEYKFVMCPNKTTLIYSKHSAQAHPHINLGILGSLGLDSLKRECSLWIGHDNKGLTNKGVGIYAN